MLEHEAAERDDPDVDEVTGRIVGLHERVDLAEEHCEGVAGERVDDEPLLGAEEAVDGAGRGSRRVGNGPDGHRRGAARGDQPLRRLQQRGARPFVVLPRAVPRLTAYSETCYVTRNVTCTERRRTCTSSSSTSSPTRRRPSPGESGSSAERAPLAARGRSSSTRARTARRHLPLGGGLRRGRPGVRRRDARRREREPLLRRRRDGRVRRAPRRDSRERPPRADRVAAPVHPPPVQSPARRRIAESPERRAET